MKEFDEELWSYEHSVYVTMTIVMMINDKNNNNNNTYSGI